MKKILKKILPRFIINLFKDIAFFFRVGITYFFDAMHAFSIKCNLNQDYPKLESKIILASHVIEKGFSLKDIKLGYGSVHIDYILDLLEHYLKKRYLKDKFPFIFAVSILKSYLDFHRLKKFDLGEQGARIKHFLGKYCIDIHMDHGGFKTINKIELLKKTGSNFEIFFSSRYSVRNYSGTEVQRKDIMDAILIAQKSPSACNRQTSKVYIITDKELKKKVLTLHKGNRGFGHIADKVLIVTSDSSNFSLMERNQTYIDGGIFTMALLSALHYKGIATCTLAWSVERKRDRALKKLCNIPYSESIIVLITLGQFPEIFSVAKSQRKPLSDIIIVK